MEIDDKGGESGTKIWNIVEDGMRMRVVQRNWRYEILEALWYGEFLNKEKHTSRGASSWTWLIAFDMCIFMCFLAFGISFKIQYACLYGVC